MPQPIDFQTEVGRMVAAERIQSAVDRAALAAQQRSASEAQREQVETETSVHETPETQSEHVDEQLRRRNPYGRRRRKDAKDDDQGSSHKKPKGEEGHQLDVTV